VQFSLLFRAVSRSSFPFSPDLTLVPAIASEISSPAHLSPLFPPCFFFGDALFYFLRGSSFSVVASFPRFACREVLRDTFLSSPCHVDLAALPLFFLHFAYAPTIPFSSLAEIHFCFQTSGSVTPTPDRAVLGRHRLGYRFPRQAVVAFFRPAFPPLFPSPTESLRTARHNPDLLCSLRSR